MLGQFPASSQKLLTVSRNISFGLRPRARRAIFANAIQATRLSRRSQSREFFDELEFARRQGESRHAKNLESQFVSRKSATGKNFQTGSRKIFRTRLELEILEYTS